MEENDPPVDGGEDWIVITENGKEKLRHQHG